MANRHRDGEPSLWLNLALQPGAVAVLAVLFNRGTPMTLNEICESVMDQPRAAAIRAVRRLGGFGLLRRTYLSGGSWDDPDPWAAFELTERGRAFTQTLAELTRLAAEHLPAGRWHQRVADRWLVRRARATPSGAQN